MKKILSMLLALSMCLSLSAPAFAAEIENKNGSLYRYFKLKGEVNVAEDRRTGVAPPGICPRCGHGMPRGHIRSFLNPRMCYWIDDNTTEPFSVIVSRKNTERMKKAGAIIIFNEWIFQKKVKKTTYYCPVCRWLITDLSE